MTSDKQKLETPTWKNGEGYVRVGPLEGIPALVRELGQDPERLIRESGFEPAQFTDPDIKISFVSASRLLARCVDATGCEEFGLRLGERSRPSSLGLPAFVLRNAPDVGTALRTLLRYLSLHDQGGLPIVHMQGGIATLGYAIHQPGAEATDQIYDLAVVMACNIMRELCGKNWNPIQAMFPRKAPADVSRYKRLFRAPLKFDSQQAAVVFSNSWLDHRIPGADAVLFSYLEREARKIRDGQIGDPTNGLHWTIRQLLLQRRCSIANVARTLGLHERTLDRRLRDQGTTYRLELEKIRYNMARQYLADTGLPLAEIAATLDYSDTTSFARAFKRWSGIAPSAWRDEKRSSGSPRG